MSDAHLESFLDFCSQLLNLILEVCRVISLHTSLLQFMYGKQLCYSFFPLFIFFQTNIPSEVAQMPKFPVEHFWQGHENSGRTPLILMALSQKASGNHIVFIHFLLATVLHLIVTFQMKSSKPFSLFGPAVSFQTQL